MKIPALMAACLALSLGLAAAPSPAEAAKGRSLVSSSASSKAGLASQQGRAAKSLSRPTPPTASPGSAPTNASDLRLGQVGRSSCGGKMIVPGADGTESIGCQRRR